MHLGHQWSTLSRTRQLPIHLSLIRNAITLALGHIVPINCTISALILTYITSGSTRNIRCGKRYRTILLFTMVLACLAACSHRVPAHITSKPPRILPLPLPYLIYINTHSTHPTSVNPCSSITQAIPIQDPRPPNIMTHTGISRNQHTRTWCHFITALELAPLLLLQPSQLAIPALALLPTTPVTLSLSHGNLTTPLYPCIVWRRRRNCS
jgi:hypothetical protein